MTPLLRIWTMFAGSSQRTQWGKYKIKFWNCEMQVDIIIQLLANEWGMSLFLRMVNFTCSPPSQQPMMLTSLCKQNTSVVHLLHQTVLFFCKIEVLRDYIQKNCYKGHLPVIQDPSKIKVPPLSCHIVQPH